MLFIYAIIYVLLCDYNQNISHMKGFLFSKTKKLNTTAVMFKDFHQLDN